MYQNLNLTHMKPIKPTSNQTTCRSRRSIDIDHSIPAPRKQEWTNQIRPTLIITIDKRNDHLVETPLPLRTPDSDVVVSVVVTLEPRRSGNLDSGMCCMDIRMLEA